MTLPYSPSRAVYAGNGTATVFPFAFKVWSEEQLVVSVTSPQGVTSVAQGWSAALNESGGAVTYLHEGAPLPEGWRLAIVRDMPFGQDIDLVSATRFDAQVIEDGLDQACAERQQLREQLARAVILPPTSEATPEEVVQSVYDARDAAAASAAAAAVSEATAAQSEEHAANSAMVAAASESSAAAGADRAQAWAESPAPPDPEDPDSKSAKEWALVAADNVPIATTRIPGKVKTDGASIEVAQDGTLSVPAAATNTRGISRLATPAEVRAGAAAAGSASPAVVAVGDIKNAGALMTCNTREALTASGSWTASVTGWHKIICIGGGGGGSGSGVLGTAYSPGCGGGAGYVTEGFFYLTAGQSYSVNIGAGGTAGAAASAGGKGGTTSFASLLSANGGNGGTATHGPSWTNSRGGKGFGNGEGGSFFMHPNGFMVEIRGGNGGSNGTPYGGGGGGAGIMVAEHVGNPGFGGPNASDGPTPTVNHAGAAGGAGGSGAVILEYFDPSKAA